MSFESNAKIFHRNRMGEFPPPQPDAVAVGISTKLKIFPQEVLGRGSMNTRVFKGLFEDEIPVAIKRVERDVFKGIDDQLVESSSSEVKLLRKLNNENIVRYFIADSDAFSIYIALDLCDGCLVEFVETKTGFTFPKSLYASDNTYKKVILKQISCGLEYLHELSIIHGDLKPQNVLMKRTVAQEFEYRAVISDFGLSLEIDSERSSATAHDELIGSDGWRAREVLIVLEKIKKAKQKQKNNNRSAEDNYCKLRGTKSVDIFAYGCIALYVMIRVKRERFFHPFGTAEVRNKNIMAGLREVYLSKNRKRKLDELFGDILIGTCISEDPSLRPTPREIIKHPFFWDADKRIPFLIKFFNHSLSNYNKKKNSAMIACLEERWEEFHGPDSFQYVPEAWNYVKTHDGKFSKNPSLEEPTAYNALRMIRNIHSHYGQIFDERESKEHCRELVSSIPRNTNDCFAKYFLDSMVQILPIVYLVLFESTEGGNSTYRDEYFDNTHDSDFQEQLDYEKKVAISSWMTLTVIKKDMTRENDVMDSR